MIPQAWQCRALALTCASAVTLSVACTPAPEAIAYGEETCAHCTMAISDARFGAELVLKTGKVYRFDSVECLAARYAETADPGSIHSLWVTSFTTPAQLIDIREAKFLVESSIHSPMGGGLVAVGAGEPAEALTAVYGGRIIGWREVLQMMGAQGHDIHAHPPVSSPAGR